MHGIMVNIQSVMAKNRGGKKKKEEEGG